MLVRPGVAAVGEADDADAAAARLEGVADRAVAQKPVSDGGAPLLERWMGIDDAASENDGGGRMLRRKIEDLGVTVHTQKNTVEIVDGEAGTHRLNFADGTHLEADMVVFSAGIRPRDELARACGLQVGERGGIVIDSECRTSAPDVYAIGECALWGGKVYGLVAPGYEMARITAKQILAADDATEFNGADMSTKLKLMGVDVASLGDAQGTTPGSRSVQFTDERKQIYKKLVVSEDGKYLLGGVLVGDAAEYGTLLQMMLNRIELPEAPEFLILPQADGNARPALGVDALPDSAQICSCNDVSKGALCQAVCAGAGGKDGVVHRTSKLKESAAPPLELAGGAWRAVTSCPRKKRTPAAADAFAIRST